MEVREGGASNGDFGYGKHNCFMIEAFKVKIELDLESEVKRLFKNVLSFLYD